MYRRDSLQHKNNTHKRRVQGNKRIQRSCPNGRLELQERLCAKLKPPTQTASAAAAAQVLAALEEEEDEEEEEGEKRDAARWKNLHPDKRVPGRDAWLEGEGVEVRCDAARLRFPVDAALCVCARACV